MSYAVAELNRRVANLVCFGTIVELDLAQARAKVQLSTDRITAALPWLTFRAASDMTWWAPEVGEQVLVLSPSGELGSGVILPALYSTAMPPWSDNPDISGMHWADGARDEYDRAAHKRTLVLPDDGEIEITIGDTVILANGSQVTLTIGQSTVKATDAQIELDGPKILLGPAGGTFKDVARKGDQVDPNTHKITGGSTVVQAS